MKKLLVLASFLVVLLLVAFFVACGPRQVRVSGADLPCSQCHDATTTLFAKQLQWQQSGHATGGNYGRSTSASCAGCHSSEGFLKRIAAGLSPDKVKEGETNPTPPNCRTCHQIHTTYTQSDYTLRATSPVTLYISGKTFDFGEGNLCANCHQPRMAGQATGGGDVKVDTNRWGPHHGPQTASFLGIGGWNVNSAVSPHYTVVKQGCPACHLPNTNHQMVPDISVCQGCHKGATNFDIDGVQTDVKAKLAQLQKLLEAKGLLKNGSPVVGTYPNAQAGALWNYISVMEDRSSGVHNAAYLKAMLQAGIDAMSK
jgi:hypothetical protein